MASTSKCLSDFLSSLEKPGQEGNDQGDDEPDWLLGSDEEGSGGDGKDGVEEHDKEDPFFYLTTPVKPTSKRDEADEAATVTPAQQLDREAGNVATESPGTTGTGKRKKSGSRSAAERPASGTTPLKNPDKIIFNRLLLEIPHIGGDTVDLSGDVGAVGRILVQAPDKVDTEPVLQLPGTLPIQKDNGAAYPSSMAAEAAVDTDRLQPDSGAAKDLGEAPSGDQGDKNMHNQIEGEAGCDILATGGVSSVGCTDIGRNGEGGSSRPTARRRRGTGANGASSKVIVDDDMEEMSDEYVESEEESAGGSDGDFEVQPGGKRKRRPSNRNRGVSATDGVDPGADSAAQVANKGFVVDLKGVMFAANIVQMPGTALVVHVGDSQAKIEAVFNEYVQMEKKTVMSEYEEGGAEDHDHHLGGYGVDEDLPKESQKQKTGKAKKPVIASAGRVVHRGTKTKGKKPGKKASGAKRK